jgi:hypothetical protein
MLNNFVKEYSQKIIKREIGTSSWYFWRTFDGWDFLEVILSIFYLRLERY